MRRPAVLPLTRSRKRSCRRALPTRAISIRIWWTRSRRAAFWTASSAISSVRSSGARCAGGSPRAACSPLPSAWSWTGKTRSGRSSRRNTGIWMRISTAPGRRAALSPAITARQTRKKSFTVKKKWRTSSPPWKRRRGRSAPSSAASASAARRPRSSPLRCSRRRAAVWGSRRGAR